MERLLIQPGTPAVQLLADRGDPLFTSTSPQSLYRDAWRVAHRDESAADWFAIGGWQPGGGGDVVGTRAYDRAVPYGTADAIGHATDNNDHASTGTLREQTTLTLRHTPDPSLAQAR